MSIFESHVCLFQLSNSKHLIMYGKVQQREYSDGEKMKKNTGRKDWYIHTIYYISKSALHAVST